MDNDWSVILNTCDRRVHGNDTMEKIQNKFVSVL